jgi:hypothetical protein
MLLDPRRPRVGWVSGHLVSTPHPSLRLRSAKLQAELALLYLRIPLPGERSAIQSGSAGLDFQKGSLRFRFSGCLFHTVQGCRPARILAFEHVASRVPFPKVNRPLPTKTTEERLDARDAVCFSR